MLNNVPVPGQTLGASRDLINANFVTIDTAFSVNHIPYNDGAGNQGQHNFVTLPSLHTVYPLLATAANQVGLYSSAGPVSGVPELFFQRQSLGAGAGYSITERPTGNYITPSGVAYSFIWTRLPSGLLMLWGTQTNTGPAIPNGGLIITFPVGTNFPGFATTCYNVQCTMQWNDPTGANANQALVLVQGGTTRLQFRVNRENLNQYTTKGSVSFFAIGI